MAELRGNDILAEYFIREKVPFILGYAGHGAIGLLDGIYDRTDNIKVIWPRIEQAAGFMADAYFRYPAVIDQHRSRGRCQFYQPESSGPQLAGALYEP